MATERDLTTYTEHRELLRGVAYRVLGSVADAEDIVQEAWLRWSNRGDTEVADPRGYLVTVTTRLALDRLRRVKTRRETYVGQWLPEPLLTSPDVAEDAVRADSVSLAMLVVLETLSPTERAVFVLHEVFAVDYTEIAHTLDRSESAVRQLAHRAREHVRARTPRFTADRALRRDVTERFLTACVNGDLPSLLAMLAPDVTLVVDGGGEVPAPARPVVGAQKVSRFVVGVRKGFLPGTTMRFTDVNGEPAALATVDGVTYGVFDLDVDPETGLITTIRTLGNPYKLTGVQSR